MLGPCTARGPVCAVDSSVPQLAHGPGRGEAADGAGGLVLPSGIRRQAARLCILLLPRTAVLCARGFSVRLSLVCGSRGRHRTRLKNGVCGVNDLKWGQDFSRARTRSEAP